jgi:hypothetical protein
MGKEMGHMGKARETAHGNGAGGVLPDLLFLLFICQQMHGAVVLHTAFANASGLDSMLRGKFAIVTLPIMYVLAAS